MDEFKVVRSPTINDAELPQEFGLQNGLMGLPDNFTVTFGGSTSSSPSVSPITTLTGTTPIIDCNNGANKIFEITMTGNTTWTIKRAATGQPVIVRAKQGSGTTYTHTWFSTVTWINSAATAPVQTTTSNGITTYGFICRGAATYDGYRLGTQ